MSLRQTISSLRCLKLVQESRLPVIPPEGNILMTYWGVI